MYAVVVKLTVATAQLEHFMEFLRANAATSLALEAGCTRFDICHDTARPGDVLLYELYTDRAAFEAHLAARHFKAFDAATALMVEEKMVTTYAQVNV